MKVFLAPSNQLSQAMFRVAAGLGAHAPAGVRIVRSQEEADLEIIHVIGYEDTVRAIQLAQSNGRKFALIQYCYVTTNAVISEWLPLWDQAQLVWSYYDLEEECRVKNQDCSRIHFYLAPLGLDPAFKNNVMGLRVASKDLVKKRKYVIGTSGYVAGSGEAIGECYKAARLLGRDVFHLGSSSPIQMPPISDGWFPRMGLSDEQLIEELEDCEYVSGLRWVEGFELPIIEGLVCGARPICFDLPCYRRWFGSFAVFVPHQWAGLIENLEEIMSKPRPVMYAERMHVVAKFDWTKIAGEFWQRLL